VVPLPLPVPGMVKTPSLPHHAMILPDARDVQDGRMGASPEAPIRGQGARRPRQVCRAPHPPAQSVPGLGGPVRFSRVSASPRVAASA
jgi:hypothetical protein